MRQTLTAGTDAGFFVLFDPGAVRPSLRGEAPLHRLDIAEEVRQGRVLAYSPGGDGDAALRVYVDEEPEPRYLAAARETKEGVLRLPTGRLLFAGAEELSPLPAAARAESDAAEPRTGTAVRIAPGSYRVRALDMGWQEEEVEKALAAVQNAWDRRVNRWIGPAAGCVLAATVLALPAALAIAALSRGVRAALLLLLYAGIFEAVFWLLALPVIRYAQRHGLTRTPAYAAAQAEFPAAVVVLRRMGEGGDAPGEGVQFGIGYAS